MSELHGAINSVLGECLQIQHREKILILADEPMSPLAWEFYCRSKKFASRSSLVIIPELIQNGSEPPSYAAEALLECEAALLITSHSISHTKARRMASHSGVRIASMPGITQETLKRTLNGKYKSMVLRTRKLRDVLSIARTAHLSTPSGTNLELSLAGMKGYADTGILNKKKSFSNLPAGESSIAPVEGSCNGKLVIDGSFSGVGLVKNPVRMTVKNGQVIRIMGHKEAEKIRRLIRPFGKQGRNIAELGIGTNPNAVICGCTLEDEKSLGTVHIALGNNVSFGGKVSVNCHYDAVLRSPTLTLDNQSIIINGKFQL